MTTLPEKPPKRCRLHWLEYETGKSRRSLQMMAQRGEIPGAAKIGGEWMFDRIKALRWIANLEATKPCRKTGSREKASTTGASRLTGLTYAEVYAREILGSEISN